MSPLKIAIIGTGIIGPRHAQAVLTNPNTILTVIVDPSSHAIPLATSLGTAYYTSVSELLVSSAIPQAAIICTPNSTHVAIAVELLEAGIHVLVEKPISTTIASGHFLVATALQMNVKLLVGHHRRFNPYLLAAKNIIDENGLGRIIAVQAAWCLKKPSSYFDGLGEWRRSATDGGVVLINLIHEVDLLQYLLGPIVLVHALESPKTRRHDAEEGAAIILRFDSGTVGTLILSDAVPSPWNFEAGTEKIP
jgi:predicted dehydrogenase